MPPIAIRLPPIAIRPAADAAFALMDNRPVVFSEANQKIYELSKAGAYIWCKLMEQEPVETISDGLAGFGVDGSEARKVVGLALQQWLDLALVDVDWEQSANFALRTHVARHTISIRASSEQLLERLAPLFCKTSRGTGQHDVLIEIMELDDRILLRLNKTGISQCESDGLAPFVRACLTERVLLRGRSDLALHAASLITNREGLLLCGPPGAGKSTLALHLIDVGFQYGGDDIVLIAPDGTAEGIPFSPAVKSGSWEGIAKLRSDLDDAVVYRRPDGIRVRYAPVAHVHAGRFSTDRIIFLNRIEDASTELTPLGQIETMRRMIDGTSAADRKLSRSGFVTLKRIVTRAKSFELTYSDAVQACGMLVDLCHGQL